MKIKSSLILSRRGAKDAKDAEIIKSENLFLNSAFSATQRLRENFSWRFLRYRKR